MTQASYVVDLAKDPSPWHLQKIAHQHLKNIACEKMKTEEGLHEKTRSPAAITCGALSRKCDRSLEPDHT
jgi:hypothetical protein